MTTSFALQISVHLEKDCPLTLISCPYSQVGCTTKVIEDIAITSCEKVAPFVYCKTCQ